MKELSKEQIKERSKHLRQILKEKHKVDLPHSHALEIMAKVLGFNDWNTAAALSPTQKSKILASDQKEPHIDRDLPLATKFRTAGDYIDFFSKFDRNKKVIFNEYKETELDYLFTPTSVCSATFDHEIQNGSDIRLELTTEEEENLQLQDFGKSGTQKFERTKLGRLQRVIKLFNMQNSFWEPSHFSKTDQK